MNRLFYRFALLLFGFTLSQSCKSTIELDNNGIDNYNGIISPYYIDFLQEGNRIISYDKTTGIACVSVKDEKLIKKDGVFVWTSESEASIRRIVAYSINNGIFVLETEPASLSDVFYNANFSLILSNENSETSTTNRFYPKKIVHNTKQPENNHTLSGSKNVSSKILSSSDESSSLSIDGQLSFQYDISMDFFFTGKKELFKKLLSSDMKCVININGNTSLSAGIKYKSSNFLNHEEEIVVLKGLIPEKGMFFYPFGVPVYVSCSADLMADSCIEMVGSFEAGINATYNIETNSILSYSQSSNKLTCTSKTKKELEPLDCYAHGNIDVQSKVSLFPRINAHIYSIGPSIDIKPYFKQQIEGNTEINSSSESLSLTMSSSIGMEISSRFHTNPFSNNTEDDATLGYLPVFEKEIYCSPAAIKFDSVSEDNYCRFSVYDKNMITGEYSPCILPIPVKIEHKTDYNTHSYYKRQEMGGVSIHMPSGKNEITASIETPSGVIEYDNYSNEIIPELVALVDSVKYNNIYKEMYIYCGLLENDGKPSEYTKIKVFCTSTQQTIPFEFVTVEGHKKLIIMAPIELFEVNHSSQQAECHSIAISPLPLPEGQQPQIIPLSVVYNQKTSLTYRNLQERVDFVSIEGADKKYHVLTTADVVFTGSLWVEEYKMMYVHQTVIYNSSVNRSAFEQRYIIRKPSFSEFGNYGFRGTDIRDYYDYYSYIKIKHWPFIILKLTNGTFYRPETLVSDWNGTTVSSFVSAEDDAFNNFINVFELDINNLFVGDYGSVSGVF